MVYTLYAKSFWKLSSRYSAGSVEKRSNEQMTPNSVKLYIYIFCVFEIGVEIQLRRCLVMTTCAEYAAGGECVVALPKHRELEI